MLEKKLLDSALSRLGHGGVRIRYWDGSEKTYGPVEPYVTITIKDPSVVRRMARNVSLGVGEGYSKGLIDVDGPLTDVIRLSAENPQSLSKLVHALKSPSLHRNKQAKQKGYIAHHYDLGNDFYKLWLDKSMLYTCAYFRKPTNTLEQAQQDKIDYVLKKLRLEKGMSLADLGCGWGDLLITAAKKYKVTGIGVTLSEEQVKWANERAKKEGVAGLVTFKLMNYQDLPHHMKGEQFDRVASVGMMEHVGRGNHHKYFKAVDKLLKPGGVSFAHFISSQKEIAPDAWIDKYIFPGGYLPSPREIVTEIQKANFRLTDYENIRYHYALTLHEWRKRFNAHKKEVIEMFDEEFYRMWDFWLACSEGSFKYGGIDLSHFVFTKGINNDLPLTREDWYK